MTNVNFYTNKDYAKDGVFLTYQYSECQYWTNYSDYCDFFGMRFSPHPEEHRLHFFQNTQQYGSDYYRVGLQTQEELFEDVSDDFVTQHCKYWDAVLEENKGSTDIKNLGASHYVNSVWGIVELFFQVWERIQELIKDNDGVDENITELFGNELVGYRFNRFDSSDWTVTEDGEEWFCNEKGLKVLSKFFETAITKICISEKEREVCDYADDLVEFFQFILNNSREFSTIFFSDQLIISTLKNMTSKLWFGNPYVHMVGLYEHSGMCLEWGRSCRWDSTSNAALIIGSGEIVESIFNDADNLLRGNVFDIEIYQVIKETDLKYFDDTEIIKVDKDIAKQFGVDDTELNVISLCSSGYVFDYCDESGILDDLDFDLIEPRPYSVEMTEKYEATVGTVPEQQIDQGKLPLGITVVVYVDRTKITGNSESEINDFIKTIVWKEVNEK